MRSSALIALGLLLGACSHAPLEQPSRSALAQWHPSPNHNARGPVLIVIHATEQASMAQSVATLTNPDARSRVSAHYLIGDDGRILQLVDDGVRAWHAGGGRWGTITDLNSASIGIELDNLRGEAFTDAQLDALIRLLTDLCDRHGIPRTQVIGHADLAPTRKQDPGALFPWAKLAEAGFGLWAPSPLQPAPAGFDPWLAMATVGYPLDDRAAAVRAFHRHYRGRDDGEDPDPQLDDEDLRILHALAALRVAPRAR